MSIIIRGMNKPVLCNKCPMFYVEWNDYYANFEGYCAGRDIVMFPAENEHFNPDDEIDVPDDCPIEQEDEDDGK